MLRLPTATDWFIQMGSVTLSATADVRKTFMIGSIGDGNEWRLAA
jgi:hypothetical protein